MAQKGMVRLSTKHRTDKVRKQAPAVVDSLHVRMPAPSDTNVSISSLSSSADNSFCNENMEGSSSISMNDSFGRTMTDIMLEMQDEFSSHLVDSGSIDQSDAFTGLQPLKSPSPIITDVNDADVAQLRDSPISIDDVDKYTKDLTVFIKDHETSTWTPRKNENELKIHTENAADTSNTTQHINEIEHRQVRQFVEKLKKAVSSHSLSDDVNNDNTDDNDPNHRQRYVKLGHQMSSLCSIWDEPNPIPSDFSDSGSDGNSFEIPSFPELQRPTLPSRQSSDADINATWVKDQHNAPIAWLSRRRRGSFINAGFACPVPAKFISDTKPDLDMTQSCNEGDVTDGTQWIELIPTSEVRNYTFADIPTSTTPISIDEISTQSLSASAQVPDVAFIDNMLDTNALSTVSSPTSTIDERSGVTDASSIRSDCNVTADNSTGPSILPDSAQQEDMMLVNDSKHDIIDTNLEAAPENILQAQTRPHTHVLHKHTYSFSRDVSISGGINSDPSMRPEQVKRTKSVAVSFNQPYTPIDMDPIAQAFHRIVARCDPQDYREDRCSQGAQVASRGEVSESALKRDTDQDASLATIVEHLAHLRPFGEWNHIRFLDLSHQNLSVISGLRECVPSLEVLIISNNVVTHIDKLPRRLRQLKAHHNRLTSCTGMSDLHDLTYLNVSYNMLESLRELSPLRNLQELHAENNLISSWDGVRQMKSLSKSNLSHNRLRDMDLSQSTLPSLEMLNLAFNRIERLENIENIPSLRAINLDHNEIKWINIYQPLRSLELLRLSFNRLRVLDASPFPSMKTLYLDDNQLLTVKNLSYMTELDSFSMRDQGGHKVDIDMSELSRARKLFLSGNPLPDLGDFKQFANLEYLELCAIQLESLPHDFSFHFPNLIILYLGGNYLNDIASLAGCSHLQKLVLVDNRLDDRAMLTRTLKQLPSLLILDLRHNTLTSKFYATLSNPTGPSEDHISHYLSYEHDLRWRDNDHVFNRCMPPQWRGKREEYRASILKACKKVKSLDGLKVDKNECMQAKHLLRARSKQDFGKI